MKMEHIDTKAVSQLNNRAIIFLASNWSLLVIASSSCPDDHSKASEMMTSLVG